MPSDETVGLASNLRLGELPRLLRRVLGLRYLDAGDFSIDLPDGEATRLRGIARRARGDGPVPILVLGVLPRSGTNFIHDLLSLDETVHADPGRLYEFPLLQCLPEAEALLHRFIGYFPGNAEVMGKHDMLARLSGAWLRELQQEAGDRRILLKCPHVQYLSMAPIIFPDCDIVVCVRDGRDVIDSSQKTFSGKGLRRKSFSQLAHEWALATEAAYSEARDQPRVTLVRFEDLVEAPQETASALVDAVGLDATAFPFDKMKSLPVRGSSRSTASRDTRWLPQEKTDDFNPVGRWLGWSERKIQRFNRIGGETLRRAGYQAETQR